MPINLYAVPDTGIDIDIEPTPKKKKGNPGSSGYDRRADDWYREDPSVVRALLNAERFYGTIVDPACGAGTIPKACWEHGYTACGFDIADRGFGGPRQDFFETDYSWADSLIANPPYSVLEKFALKAIGEAKHKVALLIPLARLEGDGRFQRLFEPHPPSRVLVFRNRINVPPGDADVPAKGGKVAFCWLIFSKDHRGPSQLDWIRA